MAEGVYADISETIILRFVTVGGPSSIPYHCIWDLFWTKRDRDSFLFFEILRQFSVTVIPYNIFHSCSTDDEEESFWKRLWTCRLTDYWWWWWWWWPLMLNNVVFEGVVNTGMLSLSLCVPILLIFHLSSSIPQYIMSCLKETQPISLM